MDAREMSEVMWQLHSIGQKLDKDYRIDHRERKTRCGTYKELVIEYGYQPNDDGTDQTE